MKNGHVNSDSRFDPRIEAQQSIYMLDDEVVLDLGHRLIRIAPKSERYTNAQYRAETEVRAWLESKLLAAFEAGRKSR